MHKAKLRPTVENSDQPFILSRENTTFAPAFAQRTGPVNHNRTDTLTHTTTMGVTELKRKGRRNRAIASNKVNAIKQLTRKPTIKNVDVDAIKASFAENKAA